MPQKFAFEGLKAFLLKTGKISDEELKKAMDSRDSRDTALEEVLITRKLISEEDLLSLVSQFLNIKFISLDINSVVLNIPLYLPGSLARKYHLVPTGMVQDKLIVAMAYPFDPYAIDDISFATGYDVEPVLAVRREVDELIETMYPKKNGMEDNVYNIDSANIKSSTAGIDSAPAVSMLNSILGRAVKSRASDIHIEPFEDYVRVRFRIDGELREDLKAVKNSQFQLISRIKILSNLNIAEKRIPQEGRIFMNIEGEDIDLRVSIMPTAYGEKAAIRILKRRNFLMSKEDLGFKKCDLEKIESMIGMHCGIILITGPTGSGKSTTLYTLLNELNTVGRNIVTIEDPVEYMIEGINQISMNTKVGLTFASGLRTVLRQDPDVIMIGEIRDQETAEIAIRAAITGHLVFSTLHTSDAPGSVIRLIEMGIQPFLISTALIGSIAQRLVKRICPACKHNYFADGYEKSVLGVDPDEEVIMYKGGGCSVCGYSGYYSRIAVYEIMDFKGENRSILSGYTDLYGMRDRFIRVGMKTLEQNCIELVKEGVTTVDELVRIMYN